ncbi:MAG: oligosaccharide flippase family protein [Gemmatimonadaceae bacterium]|nr:oligosaccharide flippase family protein [Gemmatimonadaceae bacterium]
MDVPAPGAPHTPASQARIAAEHAESAARDLRVAGRNAVTLGGSLILTWGVAFFVRFQLPRYLGPAQFGAFNFADAFSAAFFTLAELGVDTYIIREVTVRQKHASDFAGGVLVARLLAALVLLCGMWIALSASGRPAVVQHAVLVFGLAQLATINNNSMAALLQASTHVKRLAVANVLSKVIWGAGLAVVILLEGSLPLLVLPLLVAELVKTAMLLPQVRTLAHVEFRFDRVATKLVLLASLPYFLNSGAVNIGARLTAAALEFATSDKNEVGWYGASANLAGLAMLLSPLISWVMMPLLARARDRSEREAYAILRRAIEALMVMIIPFTLFIILAADELVLLAFGAKFANSAPALRVLAFDFMPMYIAIIASAMLVLNGRHWAVTATSVVAIPLRALAIGPLAALFGRWYGVGGVAMGAALTEVIGISLTAVVSLWLCGRQALDRRAAVAIAKSLAVALVVLVLDRLMLPLGFIRLPIDMLAYVAVALAIRVVTIADLRALLAIVKAGRAGETPSPAVIPDTPA